MTDTLTASEVCAAAGCVASTLRAWRNRNGLFADRAGPGWTRFSIGDAIGVSVVVGLTSRGFAAQDAVDFVNGARELLDNASKGLVKWVGVGRDASTGKLEFRELEWEKRIGPELDCFDDPFVMTVNLHAIGWRVVHEIRVARGVASDDGDA